MKKKSNTVISLQSLTLGAMLTAVSIVVGIFCKNFLNFGNGLFRITFENFPIILSGLLFGPVVGAIVGAASDMLSYILSTQTFAISPIVTLGAASIGAVSGIVSRFFSKKNSATKVFVSAGTAHFVGSIVIKSFGLYAYYGSAVLVRIPLYFLITILESLIIIIMYRNRAFHRFLEQKETKK